MYIRDGDRSDFSGSRFSRVTEFKDQVFPIEYSLRAIVAYIFHGQHGIMRLFFLFKKKIKSDTR